ncbi:isochorismatase family protein [Streptomyces litchfieldiae]|uniref:Isochorismatase family protein n=1 Tax=Streptomyces litchfieldiae TaxID=3075543 RepID=A0ABU2MVZ9_9ACTN|nr:isochorismatase family protein [Streptomyces sp. DSM 44938]MDT0345813.1 isochorismatase family protein [Streptomyces sp. DSM 44938]
MRFPAGIPAVERYAMPTADEVPENVAGWRLHPDRAVLLIHDMQRFFLRPLPQDGPRGELIANAARLREAAQELGIPVAYTAQPGSMTPEQRGLLRDFWGPGMRADPADRPVVDELAPAPHDWVFTKWRYSAFHRSDLLARMRARGRDQLVVCGVYAHVGILTTALEAFTHDIQPFLAADAVADFSRELHMLTLNYAAGRCAVVAPAATLLGQLRGDRPVAAAADSRGVPA